MREELSMIHFSNWFIPVLMKSHPDGICLHGFHYSDLNKPSHCYGTLQSPWNRQKHRAWCSRLSPQADQSSSKRCLVKTSTFNQLCTPNFDKSMMKTWKKCDKTHSLPFLLTTRKQRSCLWEPRQTCQMCQGCSGWCGHCIQPGTALHWHPAPPGPGSTNSSQGNGTQSWDS